MKKVCTTLLTITLLGGCANGKISHDTTGVDKSVIDSVEKLFVGIPVLASMEGSTVRLDEDWVLTVKHNKPILALQLKEVYYHPTCDIALYREKGDNSVKGVAKPYIDEEVYHVGYPIGLPISVNKGKIVGNVNMKEYPECRVIATTGVVASGMSGGAVINSKGELLGVNWGYATSTIYWNNGTKLDYGGVFVPIQYVNDWIISVTGKDYFNK